MCTGAEIMFALQAAGAAATVVSTVSALSQKKSGAAAAPEVVRTDPVADDEAARTAAEQKAQAQKIDAKRKFRANSLLSQAGAAGDMSLADTSGGAAKPKLALGD